MGYNGERRSDKSRVIPSVSVGSSYPSGAGRRVRSSHPSESGGRAGRVTRDSSHSVGVSTLNGPGAMIEIDMIENHVIARCPET